MLPSRTPVRVPYSILPAALAARAPVTTALTGMATLIAAPTRAVAVRVIAARTARGLLRLEAITAIHRTPFTRHKWDRRGLSAARTGGRKLFSTRARGVGLTTPTATATGSTAIWATTGKVRQSSAGIKLLFANGKGEVLTTVTTGKGTVLVIFNRHHRFLFPLCCIRSAKQHVYIEIEWDGPCRRYPVVKTFYRRDISRSDPEAVFILSSRRRSETRD